MTDRHILSSFPPRPLSLTEIDALEERGRIQSIVADDITIEDYSNRAMSATSVSSCVLITADTVTAAVYVDSDEAWYRVYHATRPGVDVTETYETVRSFRGEETLFASAPLSPREAVHRMKTEDKKRVADSPDYTEGDVFDCPVCDAAHPVYRREDDSETQFPEEDRFYVNCPEAESGTLSVY